MNWKELEHELLALLSREMMKSALTPEEIYRLTVAAGIASEKAKRDQK